MKGLLVFLFFCVALAAARPWDELREKYKTQIGESVYIERQETIIQLLTRVIQPTTYDRHLVIAREYRIEDNYNKYEPSEVAMKYVRLYSGKMLPRGRPYTVMHKQFLNETIALYNLFFYAKDYDTFYRTACWAREHVNEEMFVYTYTTALVRRPDTKYYYIPPIYEIIPQYFYTDEVIDRAYKVQMQRSAEDMLPYVIPGEKNVVYVKSNYSNWYYNYNREQRLAYLTEDIGWNAFYYNVYVNYPFWVDGAEYDAKKVRRGELIYYVHHQLLARYYAERLSNVMGEIPEYSWTEPIETGYEPYLSYVNGIRYPSRPNYVELKRKYSLVRQIRDYEQRIRIAIDRGYAEKSDGTHVSLRDIRGLEVLTNMIEPNFYTPDYEFYGYPQYLARELLGYSPVLTYNHTVYPSTLQMYQTSLRDPMFYQLMARYHRYFYHRYQSFLTPYTQEELLCPGVIIKNVEVSKLITYMEDYDSEITNGVYELHRGKTIPEKLVIMARQKRLNHVPFTVNLKVDSVKNTKVVVRYYLGPKYNGQRELISLKENRVNFYQIYQHVQELTIGENLIERHSEDFFMGGRDWNLTRDVYEYGRDAIKEKRSYSVKDITSLDVFPGRLLLPRGNRAGMPFYLVVVVSPYETPNPTLEPYHRVFVDKRPMGYPFDRPVYEDTYPTENVHFEDVMIFFKQKSEVINYH